MDFNGEDDFINRDNMNLILSKFELMLKDNQNFYFDVSEFIELIDLYFDQNNTKRALLAADYGLSQHPNSTEILLKKAQVLVELQNYKKAKNILQELAQIEYTNPDVLMLLGIVFLYQYETNNAINYFNKAIENNKEDAEELLLNIAIHFENVKLYDQAAIYLKKGYKENPKNFEIIYELAYSYEQVGNYELSIENYLKYLDLNPFSENAWYNLALIYDRQDEFDKAIDAFDFALAIDDEYSLAIYGKGNSLANKGSFKKAANTFKEAIVFEPDNDDLIYSIGECYEKLKNYEEAIKYYKKAIDINDKNANAWFGIGIIRFYKNELFESLFYVKKAIKLNPDDTEYWSILADINEKLEFYEDAEIALKSLLKIDPQEEDIWIKYAELLYNQNKINEAVKILTKANETIKGNSEIIYRLSAYLLESDNHTKAVEFFKQGLSLDYEKHKKFFHFDSKKIYALSIKNLIKK